MPASHASGNQTAVIATEYTLTGSAITAAGSYELNFSLDAMEKSDELNITIEKRIAGGAASVVAYDRSYADAQGEPLVIGIPVTVSDAANASVTFKFTQTAGTGRNFVWEITAL